MELGMLDKIYPITCSKYGGSGKIMGKVKVDGQESKRKIFLTERITQRLILVTWSDTDGTFIFNNLNPNIEYDIRAHDWARNRLDDILCAVKPKL